MPIFMVFILSIKQEEQVRFLSYHPEIDVSIYAYVDLLICWRNNTSHFYAGNTVLLPSQICFLPQNNKYTDSNKSVYTYHFDIGTIMDRFIQGVYPAFRENAILINTTIDFIVLGLGRNDHLTISSGPEQPQVVGRIDAYDPLLCTD